jgi:hypothetical protein
VFYVLRRVSSSQQRKMYYAHATMRQGSESVSGSMGSFKTVNSEH